MIFMGLPLSEAQLLFCGQSHCEHMPVMIIGTSQDVAAANNSVFCIHICIQNYIAGGETILFMRMGKVFVEFL